MIGKVIEVFVPNENLDMIGFKIMIDDRVIEIIDKQDDNNSNIYRNDKVLVVVNDNEEYFIEGKIDDK